MLKVPTAHKKRLLLIDDDADLRQLISAQLRDRFLVIPAVDGHDARRKATAHRPDVVLLDVGLPGMSGHQLLEHFRGSPHFQGLPVIMLTGNSQRESIVNAVKLGVRDYVLKDSLSDAGGNLCDRIEALLVTGRRWSQNAPQPRAAEPAASDHDLHAILDDWE